MACSRSTSVAEAVQVRACALSRHCRISTDEMRTVAVTEEH